MWRLLSVESQLADKPGKADPTVRLDRDRGVRSELVEAVAVMGAVEATASRASTIRSQASQAATRSLKAGSESS
jgi:hypothetical protein